MFKSALAIALAAIVTLPAAATCVGTGAYRTCTDASGNSYSTTQIGDTSYTTGRNSRTGSTWSQNSTTIGGTTYTNGRAADGDSWRATTTRIGDATYTSGVDSDGNTFGGSSYDY